MDHWRKFARPDTTAEAGELVDHHAVPQPDPGSEVGEWGSTGFIVPHLNCGDEAEEGFQIEQLSKKARKEASVEREAEGCAIEQLSQKDRKEAEGERVVESIGTRHGDGSSASPAAPSCAISPQLRYPPFPWKSTKPALLKWQKDCRVVREQSSAGYENSLPTHMKPNDAHTAMAVERLVDKEVVRSAAQSVVSVSSSTHDGLGAECSGIVMRKSSIDLNSKPSYLIATCSKVVCRKGKLLNPVPKGGSGGPVIDISGNTRGMSFYLDPYPAVLSVTTINTCIDMFLQFSFIARPLLGLGLRTIPFLDIQNMDKMLHRYGLKNGFIVEKVSYNSDAEKLGIKKGDVILSFNGIEILTLPQLEDHLLSFGWACLEKSIYTEYLELRVFDLRELSERSITLPLRFTSPMEQADSGSYFVFSSY